MFTRKLTLQKETIRPLSTDEMNAAGGDMPTGTWKASECGTCQNGHSFCNTWTCQDLCSL